jgi:hypothetical protein
LRSEIIEATEFRPAYVTNRWLVLALVWVICAWYVWQFVDRGWIPHDDGSLGQMAERVLQGDLPHRDFDEIYTGGLSMVYAGAFKLFGVNLRTIRVVLYICLLAFVPAVYLIASRFAAPPIAAAVALVSVMWSVPNYFAGLPSWYNLFLAGWGTLFVIRFTETRRARWLFAAGLCGGASFLAKLAGLYYLAAIFLYLMYRDSVALTPRPGQAKRTGGFRIVKAVVYLAYFAAATLLVWPRLGAAEAVNILVPAGCVTLLLLSVEWRHGHGEWLSRLRRLSRELIPFCAGAAIPIILFLIPYVWTGSLRELIHGVFVLSQKRLRFASMDFAPLLTAVTGIPYGLLLFVRGPSGGRERRRLMGITAVFALAAALLFSHVELGYQIIWHSARWLSVVTVIAGCVTASGYFESEPETSAKRDLLVLLVIATALIGLIQFPFPDRIYFCYFAPFVALLILATVQANPGSPKAAHMAMLVFYTLFAVLVMHRGYLGLYGIYQADRQLAIPRAGLRMPDEHVEVYTRLTTLIRDHAGSSQFIYAAPDCPEMYFLSGMRNPTRKVFDFLSEVAEDAAYTEALLQSNHIHVAVINRDPSHSPALAPQILDVLRARFPHSEDLGPFTIRWAED